MLCRFTDQKSGYSVVFDDDGRVAYAYLLNHQGNIISDVWLYSQCKTPKEPEWKTSNNMPFANSVEYSKEHTGFSKVDEMSDISIDWHSDELIEARVLIRRELFAVLQEGEKPGWCCMAKKSGPLAKVLETGQIQK